MGVPPDLLTGELHRLDPDGQRLQLASCYHQEPMPAPELAPNAQLTNSQGTYPS